MELLKKQLITVLTLSLCALPCLHAEIWDGGTGEWNTAANWDTNNVPTAGSNTQINNTGLALLTSPPQGVSSTVDLGFEVADFGTIVIIGGSLDVSSVINVGTKGRGILDISVGGIVDSFNGNIGMQQGSTGTVNVNNLGSKWNNTGDMNVGQCGTGFLNVFNGASVETTTLDIGFLANSKGTVTVSGPNTVLNVNSGSDDLRIGLSGEGALYVINGGKVTVAKNVVLAGSAGTGTLNLSGTPGKRGILTTQGVIAQANGSHEINFDGGILQALTSNGNFIQISSAPNVNVLGGGAFIDSNGYDVGINATFEGLGAITKIGEGAVYLIPDMFNEGGIIVDAGALFTLNQTYGPVVVNNSGELNTIGPLNNSLTINNDGQAQINNIVFGPVTLNDSSFLRFSNFSVDINGSITTNDISTAILDGSLIGSATINDNSIFEATRNIKGAVTVNDNGSGLFSGLVIGPVTVNDHASFQITDSGVVSGLTTVNGGTLVLSGLINNLVRVNPNGELQGTGSINGNLINAGTLVPGFSLGGATQNLGTLTVNGNYTQLSSGIQQNELNTAGETGLLAVSGTATIQGGTLDIMAEPGEYSAGTSYTLITAAGGLSGQFAKVIENLPINYILKYFPNSLVLQLGDAINSQGLTGNARRVADYINSFGTIVSGDFSTVLTALQSLSSNDLSNALDQLHPAPFQAITMTTGDAAHMVNDSFMDRLNFLRTTQCGPCFPCNPCNQGGVWISGLANHIDQDRSQGLRGFDATNGGFAIGYDQCFYDRLIVGIGSGYSTNSINWNKHYGHSNGQNAYLGIYATYFTEDYYADASLLGFKGTYKSKRHIQFSDIDRRAKSKQSNWGLNPHFGAGLILDYCDFDVIPYGEMDYYYISQDKFHEHGAKSLNLHVKSKDANELRLETGVRFAKTYNCCYGQFLPYTSISYVGHRYYGRKFKSSFNDQPNDFAAFGTDRCFNQAEFGLGFAYLINDQFAINTSYDIAVGSSRQQQEFNLELNYRF